MPPRAVRVWAPSRLHFGLLSFGNPDARQYGGAGVMVDAPGLTLMLQQSAGLSANGPLAPRALDFARRYGQATGLPTESACHIEIESAPPEHAGLGSGTQLALAVAAGIDALAGHTERDALRWARLVGRAERSAIGTHGFALGGLLVEGGKDVDETISPLVSRVELPSEWRFVLIIDRAQRGLSGASERAAFDTLPPVSAQSTAELCGELVLHLFPAAVAGNFDEFGESLYRYGYQAGLLFAKRQGGAYAGPRAAELVEWLRARGIRGVGQSSWGPTIFALVPSASAADELASDVRNNFSPDQFNIIIAAPANHGARIETLSL